MNRSHPIFEFNSKSFSLLWIESDLTQTLTQSPLPVSFPPVALWDCRGGAKIPTAALFVSNIRYKQGDFSLCLLKNLLAGNFKIVFFSPVFI